MNRLRFIILYSFFYFGTFINSFGQTDTMFWLGAPAVCPTHEINYRTILRFSTYSQPANIEVSVPNNPFFTPLRLSLASFQSGSMNLTPFKSLFESPLSPNQPKGHALLIKSTANISAYYEIGESNNPEIFVLKGSSATGNSFIIPGQSRFANAKENGFIYNPQPKNGFVMVATENNTTITVTPKQNTTTHPAGIPFTVTLNKGETYTVVAERFEAGLHLEGSFVKSNKPITITVYDDSIGPPPPAPENRDLIGDQILPEDRNGSEFIIIRGALNFINSFNRDYFYIFPTKDNTTISINGVSVGTYNRGQVYEGFLIGSSAYITTSSPAYVTQLTGNGGEMTSVNLPTITCTGSQSVAFVRSTPEDFQLNILCKASQVNSFFINGVGGLINASHFEDVPSTNGAWKAARISLLNLPNINALIPAAITTVITNSTGLFHLGFVNGTANTGSRIGYFSNYSNRNLAPSINGNRCIGSNISIKVNNFENASYTWKGPGNFTVNPFDPSRIDITNAQLSNAGKYYMTANIPGCGFYEDSIELVLNTPPTAVLNPSEILCFGYGKSMTMTISGGTGPWNITYFDGNNIQTTQKLIDPFFSFPANNTTTKTYQILSVTDNLGCKTENPGMTPISSSTITVVPLPTAKFAGPDSVCSGKTLDLGLNFTGKAPWSFVLSTFVNDITNNSQYTYSHIPQTGGNITILTVADGNGCVANNTDTKFIRLLNNPIANFDVSAENCLGTTTTVTNASSGNGNDIKSYAWELSDGTKYSTPTFSHQFTQAGTKNIALQITSTNGCVSDVFSKSTQINPVPIADFQINASSFCTNKPVSLVNNSQENGLPLVNFYWTMSDGTTYTKTNNNSFDHSFSNSGLATVSLQAENTKGCKSNIVTKNTTIHPNPIAGFKMPEICLSDGKARFVDTSFVPGNSNASFTYSWQFNTGNPAISPSPTPINSTVKNPEITFFKAANYEILQTVTSAQGCVVQSLQKFTVNGSLPKAAFSIANAVTSICANESITVKNESTVDFGSITKLEIYWNANGNIADKLTDNNPASEKTYTHQYALINSTQPQQFTVRVIAFSGDICSDVTEKTITVYPRAVIQFPAIKSICNDSLPRLINIARELTGLAGNFQYKGNGINSNGLFNPQAVAPGTYTITYQFTSINGCTDSAKSNITVWPSPKAAFKVAEPICEKNNISFSTNSNSSLGKIVHWNWEFGDNSAPISNTNANVVLHNYSTAGSYNIKHWVVSDSGCVSNTATENLIVNFLPKVSFTMPTVVCLPDGKANFGNTSSISDGSENSFSYLWSFGNPQSNEISLLKNPTHTYSTVPPTNGFPVKLVVTSNKGCKDSVTNFFKNVFPQPVANFTINPDSICLNQLVRFVDNSNGQSSNIVDWQWNLGQNDNVTSPNPQKNFRDSGNFTISLQITNQLGCISAVTQKTMTVYPNPHLKLGGNIYVLEGGSMALRPQNGGLPYYFGNDLRFLWTTKLNPNYMDDATVVSPIVTFPSNIDSAWYKLQLTAKGGCTVSDSLQLVVLRKPKVPNAFSPNGDGFNQTWYIEFIESYPDAIVEVYNRYGQMVFRRVGYKNASGWDGSYQGKPLPVGTYYYIIDPKNGREKLTGSVTIIR